MPPCREGTTEALLGDTIRKAVSRGANPNGAAALRRAGKGALALWEAVSANADRFAADLAPVIADIRAAGHAHAQGREVGVGNLKAVLGRIDTPPKLRLKPGKKR